MNASFLIFSIPFLHIIFQNVLYSEGNDEAMFGMPLAEGWWLALQMLIIVGGCLYICRKSEILIGIFLGTILAVSIDRIRSGEVYDYFLIGRVIFNLPDLTMILWGGLTLAYIWRGGNYEDP